MRFHDRPGSAVAILIVAFCVWHMSAVALYVLPSGEHPWTRLRTNVTPYILSLSQWQKWDIFSPNPLRRNSIYRIERDAGDRFETAMILDFDHLAWHERAKELKVLGRLQDSWKRLLPDYLSSLCPRIPGGPGNDVRLYVETTILPSELPALKRIAETTKVPSKTELASAHCPRF
ncbi:MAG: hypothetical protein KBA40_02420 [Candidatus Peribacteraceae bacterium]|nr:hypothetical protein [Candidatus Peribacteraceae bacterium]MBP9850744.1 hypothetical protein [Candidatus Peribacteraceae bacterium]